MAKIAQGNRSCTYLFMNFEQQTVYYYVGIWLFSMLLLSKQNTKIEGKFTILAFC